MLLPEKKPKKGIGLVLRLTPTAPYGARPSQKLLPSEVCNLFWAQANAEGKVAFSTNAPIDIHK